MERYLVMNIMRVMLLVVALVATACGGEKSVASKSAEAYREAQAKGTPVGGGHEHGHAATETDASVDHGAHGMTETRAAAMDHSAHGTGGDAHAGMNRGTTGDAGHSAHGGAAAGDHAARDRGTSATNAHADHGTASGTSAAGHAALDHGATGADGHAGYTAGTSGVAHDGHAGMQRTAPATAASDPHAQHESQSTTAQMDHSRHGAIQMPAGTNAHALHGSASTPTPVAVQAPRSSAEMQRLQPAATLRGDAFDAPAPSAVSEASKAAQGGGHTGHEMSGTAAPAGKTVYTCPMHPEVTSGKRGTCPKCGMTLVPKKEK